MRLNKLILMLTMGTMFSLSAMAEEANLETNITSGEDTIKKVSSLDGNIKRMALEYVEHSVTNKNDPYYPDSYNSDEQRNISGVFDGNLVYNRETMVWTNGLYAIYSKSKTTEKGVTTTNENDDEILLFTDYTHKVWQLEQGIVGPFAYLGYETEFTTFELNDKDYRTKILRAKGGIKLYDGKYFKQLYIALVEEDDMTYNNDNMKTGAEIGYEFNYPINPYTSFVSEGYFRRFMTYSEKELTDFKYKLSTENRIEMKLIGDWSLAPFYRYEQALTRGASSSRAQTTLGLSLSYNKSFGIF